MKTLRETAFVRIVLQIARFAAGSLVAYSSEIGAFALLVKVVFRRETEWVILFSMVAARALSILVQYTINRTLVFHSRIHLGMSFARYLLVNLSLLGCSYALVRLARSVISFDITFIKMAVDLLLFFANFTLNRVFVFVAGAEKREHEHPSPNSKPDSRRQQIISALRRPRIPGSPAARSATKSSDPGQDRNERRSIRRDPP